MASIGFPTTLSPMCSWIETRLLMVGIAHYGSLLQPTVLQLTADTVRRWGMGVGSGDGTTRGSRISLRGCCPFHYLSRPWLLGLQFSAPGPRRCASVKGSPGHQSDDM